MVPIEHVVAVEEIIVLPFSVDRKKVDQGYNINRACVLAGKSLPVKL